MADEVKNTPAPEAEEEEVPPSTEERLDKIESVILETLEKLEQLELKVTDGLKAVTPKSKGLFGGKRTRTPMKDLKTGIVYPSKAAAGKALAGEFGLNALESTVYYEVLSKAKMPDGSNRLVDASPEEGAKAIAERDAELKKQVEEANAKIAADEAAKAKAQTAPPATQPAATQTAVPQKQTPKGKGK